MLRIDNTQFQAWLKCPWYWWEKFGQGWQRAYPDHQRDDAMATGALVHSALENLQRHGRLEIDPQVIEEIGPTPECVQEAGWLAGAYMGAHGREAWEVAGYEEPVEFRMQDATSVGVAKVDMWFRVTKNTTIDNGLGGVIYLKPGLWLRDYKTRAAGGKRENWIQGWVVNKQADFQMLALGVRMGEEVKGLLVSVIEKPRVYVPERTCKGCRGKFEYGTWVATVEVGMFGCPMCGNVQKLDPPKREAGFVGSPLCWSMVVERTPEQLARSYNEIASVVTEMKCFVNNGERVTQDFKDGYEVANTRSCSDPIWGPCEFFEAHTQCRAASEVDGFVKVDTLRYLNGTK